MEWRKRGKEKTLKEVFIRNIGVDSLNTVNEWVKKSSTFAYRIDKLKEAVAFIKQFLNLPVYVFGDYDADGITSTTILVRSLRWAGFKSVKYRIPKRFSEGFGLNKKMVDEATTPGLIITCDNGVAQKDVIEYAKGKGFSVVVIDHHMPVTTDEGDVLLPPADYIIDPNAIEGSADYNGYCGAGLSYRFACELLNYAPEFVNRLLPLAAIGTVADVMEFREENYYIVRTGLKLMANPRCNTTGLNALLNVMGVPSPIKADNIGFKIGPAINASSRMNDEGAKDAVEILLFDDSELDAREMALHLDELNKIRKKAQKEAIKAAYKIVEENQLKNDVPLVVTVPNIGEGIIGLVAGHFCEKFKVPAIVFTNVASNILKGSARACGEYHMKKNLDVCKEFLFRYGGHKGAAGLSVKNDKFEDFVSVIHTTGKSFTKEDDSVLYFDLEIEASDIDSVLPELEKYEPFGEGNPAPVFKINNFLITPRYGVIKDFLGEENSIVKFYGKNMTAIGFDMAEATAHINAPTTVSFLGTLSVNRFNGKAEAQIEFFAFEEKKRETRTSLANLLNTI